MQSGPDLEISQAFVIHESHFCVCVCVFFTSQNVEPSTNKSFLKILKAGSQYLRDLNY